MTKAMTGVATDALTTIQVYVIAMGVGVSTKSLES
jgi:hypothetical protein